MCRCLSSFMIYFRTLLTEIFRDYKVYFTFICSAKDGLSIHGRLEVLYTLLDAFHYKLVGVEGSWKSRLSVLSLRTAYIDAPYIFFR